MRLAIFALVLIPVDGITPIVAQPRQLQVFPGRAWDRVTPESVGFSSTALSAARARLAATASTGLMAIVGGRVVFEYGNIDTVSYVASVRKSILSMLYGVHVQRGQIDLDATLTTLGIDDRGSLTAMERQARVRDLLTARSGVFHSAANDGDDLARAPARGTQRPGTYFLYNNWDFNVLGTYVGRYELAPGAIMTHHARERPTVRPTHRSAQRRDLPRIGDGVFLSRHERTDFVHARCLWLRHRLALTSERGSNSTSAQDAAEWGGGPDTTYS